MYTHSPSYLYSLQGLTFHVHITRFKLPSRYQANNNPAGGSLFNLLWVKAIRQCLVGFGHAIQSGGIQPCCYNN